jgi:hypothetical protein
MYKIKCLLKLKMSSAQCCTTGSTLHTDTSYNNFCARNGAICNLRASEITVGILRSEIPFIDPMQGPNAILVGCGLVGNGTAPLNPVELERTTEMGSGAAPEVPFPVDGFLRDHLIAENPCDPRETNFQLTVAHSAAGHGINMGFSNTLPNDGTVRGAVISGGESNEIGSSTNQFFNTIGGGFTNTIATGLPALNTGFATLSGGVGNTIGAVLSSTTSTIAGGSNNTIEAIQGTIGGGASNDILNQSDESTIAGGTSNDIGSGATSVRCTVGGGSSNTIGSGAACNGGVIGGGLNNRIGTAFISNASAIGGGNNNTINAQQAFIGGGNGNEIQNQSDVSAIACGTTNMIGSVATTVGSFIGCGDSNLIDSDYSTIPGGQDCVVSTNASHSLATGHMATVAATHDHSMVFSCDPAGATSSQANEVRFALPAPAGTGRFFILNLPTADPGVPGALWRDPVGPPTNVLRISP